MAKDLGILAQQLRICKEAKTELNSQITVLNAEIKELQIELLEGLKEQNLSTIGDGVQTVYIAHQVVPHVVNWEALYKYIHENEAYEMLHRRISLKPFQESYEQGIEIPGIDPVVFDEVRTRKS